MNDLDRPASLALAVELPLVAPTVAAPPRPTAAPASSRAKRALDLVGASIALVAVGPILFLAAVAVLISSGRPIFYWQERVGLRGQLFRMCKLRSMRRDAERDTGPVWARDKDERCTTVGAFLRKTNLDELPQLWNVIKGEMSLVGPRPERPVFVEQFRDAIPRYHERHDAPAGMTGWAQVHGWRGRTSLRKRIQYDLDYIRRWSVGLDLVILLMTVQHVLFGKTRWGNRGRDKAARVIRLGRRRLRRDPGKKAT